MSTTTIAAYGEALWDLLPSGPAVLGGAPLNFIYRITSLGYRGRMISKLGDDEFGRRALAQMTALGLETAYIQRSSASPTGTVNITLDEHKNPDYVITPDVAYDDIRYTEALGELIAEADCLCFGSLIQRAAASRQTLHTLLTQFTGAYALYDINLRKQCYTADIVRATMEHSTILKLNDDEMVEVAGMYGLPAQDIAAFTTGLFQQTPLHYCVVTLGAQGAFAASRDGEQVYEPGHRIELVDPCGSGDAFTAGFLHKLLQQEGLRQACRFGNAMGAMAAEQHGATQPIALEAIAPFVQTCDRIEIPPQFQEYAT